MFSPEIRRAEFSMSNYEIERNNFSREEKRCLSRITHGVELEYVTHPKTFMITRACPPVILSDSEESCISVHGKLRETSRRWQS
jgi:hypothetical protein